jgi:hypothetical protein
MSYLSYSDANDDVEGDLARGNGFTHAELETNRRGRIADRQFFRLMWRAIEPFRYALMALAGWLLLLVCAKTILPAWATRFIMQSSRFEMMASVAVITTACLGTLIVSSLKGIRRALLLLIDIARGKAAFVEGRVYLSREQKRGLGLHRVHGEDRHEFHYVLKNEYFPVTERGGGALVDGMRYRLYCTPLSRLMLSIEPARGADEVWDRRSSETAGQTAEAF